MSAGPRQVVIHRAGAYDQLKVEPLAVAEPPPGQVRIAVRAAGVNYADVVVRMGLYSSAKKYVGWPITPGFEVAGEVLAVGEGVDGIAVGEHVFAVTRFGGYTSHLMVPAHQVWHLPQGLSFVEAAGLPAVFGTAWFALHFLAPRALFGTLWGLALTDSLVPGMRRVEDAGDASTLEGRTVCHILLCYDRCRIE